jgi:WD40 repeat protein/DNA-binding SARP family transcriptional activator
VDFRVLGPLEVAGDGTAGSFPGRRERALLAALVLNVDEVVSSDRLVSALWRDRPPRSAAKIVQNLVMRLRKALGSSVIETRAPGYRLVLDGSVIDVHQFEDRVAFGRTARVNGTPDRAAAALRDALVLWRGSPFEDLSAWEPAESEAARLHELRRIASEELMDAELACGRHVSCVAELERMVADEPFRERRWAMLMLALYRCGRQGDALRAYQRARTALTTELGLEPGPELRALERAVFAQEESLDPPGPVLVAGPGVEPTASIVFILFSDVVASTEMADRLGDEAAAELRCAHLRLLRGAVADHAGREVKNVGDGLMVEFTSGVDAVCCAVEMQRVVEDRNRDASEPVRVRIGLHVGEPVRDEGDLSGRPVVIARRLCEAAAPGQIVASDLVRELVGAGEQFAFVDAGALALAGLEVPVPSVEILSAAAATDDTEPRPEAEPPYKGMVRFEPEDSGLFFGRDAIVGAVIDRMSTSRLVAMVGPSGTGKSSLLRAGVVAALRGDGMPASSAWPTLLMTPGSHPVEELADLVSRWAGVGPRSVLDDLRNDARALNLAARQAAALLPCGSRVVLVIDQFEELFTHCRDESERWQFVDALVHAATVTGGVTTVVLAIRADFYGHCGAYPELARLVESGTVLLSPMHPEEVAAAIEGPARVAGLRLEPGLADVVVRDLAGQPGALPLLSHALLETWKRRRGRILTVKAYQDAGGVGSAIARTAESVYGRLDPAEQTLARNVFVRLTELGEGTEDSRRRVTIAELAVRPDETEHVEWVLHTLTDARLVTMGQAGVELAHEALIREWPRLRDWLDDDREGLRIHRHLTHAAHDWAALGRDPTELYRGPRLAAALDWQGGGREPPLNPLEHEFLVTSRARQEQEKREDVARLRRLRRLLAGVGLALVAALVAGSLAVVQGRRADDEARAARDATLRADVGRLVAESATLLDGDRYLATGLALEANRLADTSATRDALLNALVAEPRLQATMSAGDQDYFAAVYVPPGRLVAARSHDVLDFFDTRTGSQSGRSIAIGPGDGVTASPDGTLVATGSNHGEVTLWNVATREPEGPPLRIGHPSGTPAFSPDSRLLVTPAGGYALTSPLDTSESVLVWDVVTRERVDLPLSGHTTAVNAAAFSPDGHILATGGNDSTVVLHNAATGATLGQLPTGSYVTALEFSPDGQRLGVGTQAGDSQIYDVTTRQRLVSLPGSSVVSRLRFSPDGRRVATLSDTAQIWNAATFEPIAAPMNPQVGPINGAFSPDGGTLAIAGDGGFVALWDPDGHARIAEPIPGSSPLGGVFSPDGKLIAVPDFDHVTLYGTETLDPVAPPLPVPAGPRVHGFQLPGQVAFSPDGHVLAVSGPTRTIQLYRLPSVEPVGDPIPLDAPPASLAFSPDGHLLAVGSSNDTVTLVDSRNGTAGPPQRLGLISFVFVAFSPDGRRLVAGSASGGGGGVILDLTEEPLTAPLESEPLSDVLTAAFSPDGQVVATGDVDGTVQFRDARTFQPLGAPVASTDGPVLRLAFSPDGSLLAAGDYSVSSNSSTRLIDVATRQPIGDAFPGASGYVSFSPDGTTVAMSSPSATLLWDLDIATWREQACQIAGGNLTAAEMRKYLPNDPDAPPTCSRFPSA